MSDSDPNAFESDDQLPKGWSAAKIAQFTTKVGSGATPRGGSDSYKSTGTPLIRSQNVHLDGFRDEGLAFIDDTQAEALADATVEASDVLLNITGASIGRVTLAPQAMAGARVNQHVCIIRPSKLIDPAYVAFHWASPAIQQRIMTEEYGVTRQALTKGWILDLEIPIPPRAEQKRIVAKIEALLARVNAARERLAKVPALLKRFRQSVLAAACSGQLTADWREPTGNGEEIPTTWSRGTVESVCSDIVDCPHSTPQWTSEGEICLRTTNFLPGRLNLSEVRYVSRETYASRVARLEPKPGDVLYSREGGILGIACLFPTGLRACLGQRMMLMRTKPRVLPGFLMHTLNCPATLAIVRELTGGTASPHLNVGDVKRFAALIPPIEEQRKVVERADALVALSDRIESRAAAANARVEKITQAILAKAFRGELVPTEAELARSEGRDYEPASVLLERIRREHEAAVASAPAKTAKSARKAKRAEPTTRRLARNTHG